MDNKLQQVCKAFRIEGEYVGYEEIKVGNVNRTYKANFIHVDGNPKSYILQKVNTYVFQKPVEVMENIDHVTEYIRARNPGRKALHFHHTEDRKTYVFEREDFWRLLNYIPSDAFDVGADLGVVRRAGAAFGEFQMMLSDFPAEQLHETIPDFHNTAARYEKFIADVQNDPCGKVQEAREEIDWLLSVKETACRLMTLHDAGKLPLRVTHNDTKINNVLFDRATGDAVVIDLDTVMPGLVGADFGDAIRFAANFVEEDCPQAEKAGVDMEVFRAFAEGFLSRTAVTLTREEIDTLALSCFVLAAELAVRFLDDYILGSPYFKINYPEHNLVRARCQIALAKDMLAKMDAMDAIVQECVEKYC